MQVLVFKSIFCANGFKLALISKGLRQLNTVKLRVLVQFQACPYFKGIKTPLSNSFGTLGAFQACPDFKGIKTGELDALQGTVGFKLALISKGLRRQSQPHLLRIQVSSLP